MKKVIDNLNNKIENIIGSVIYIGSDNSILKNLENNNNITYCDVLNTSNFVKKKSKAKGKSTSLNIKEFKKFYGKNNLNHIVCDLKEIKRHLPRFIQTSIYIGCGNIYIYGNKDLYDLERLCKKYKRYNCDIKIDEYIDDYLIEIDVSKAKNKIIKDKLYYIVDTLGILADNISDLIIG